LVYDLLSKKSYQLERISTFRSVFSRIFFRNFDKKNPKTYQLRHEYCSRKIVAIFHHVFTSSIFSWHNIILDFKNVHAQKKKVLAHKKTFFFTLVNILCDVPDYQQHCGNNLLRTSFYVSQCIFFWFVKIIIFTFLLRHNVYELVLRFTTGQIKLAFYCPHVATSTTLKHMQVGSLFLSTIFDEKQTNKKQLTFGYFSSKNFQFV